MGASCRGYFKKDCFHVKHSKRERKVVGEEEKATNLTDVDGLTLEDKPTIATYEVPETSS